MASTDAPSKERRTKPHSPVHGGRRWRDDPDLTAAVDRLLAQVSKDFFALRDTVGWSQEEMAIAAGVAANTILGVEKAQDAHLSTLARLAHVRGYELDIRLRRVSRPPQPIAVNHSASAGP